MNKVEQLWIRACKSGRSKQRLLSVYRRFYLKSAYTNVRRDEWMAVILMEICKEYCPIDPTRALTEMSPANDWKYRGLGYYERLVAVITSHIRFTEASKLQGLTAPCMFRNREAALAA